MTQRTGFVLRVRPERIDEYVEAHRHVWPEMLAECRAAGIRNYTIFRDGTSMFGYYECDDPVAAAPHMAASAVNTRWQDAMAELLEARVEDGAPPSLPEVFRLD